MSPIEQVALVLAEAGHSPADVAHCVRRLQEILAMRGFAQLPKMALTTQERARAYLQLREGYPAEVVAATLKRA
ncbi:hypothetical protein MQC88_02615 [Luteimonas sp. 50]|uniref:Uncharacterized protein n=1 Tax=Cognatiluteimonas sedimenti TaxID=2927791 RepID=A0ABT0A1K7_9GAMM|nr:hypothetical protein [Lysobacter sedimenti]MCJ0824859.1 hypothetical protein [Lysobacter sedimenti]